MFESTSDLDFGDEFTIDFDKFNKGVKNKRSLEVQNEAPKKRKIIPLPKHIVKRKFPGPAGLLSEQASPDKNHEEIVCSQMSVSVFQSSPWLDMSREYEALIERYNIQWIKTNARLNTLQNRSAPFLAAIIKSIECFEGKPSTKIVLKDASGEIQGSLTHHLYEEYSQSLVPGSVIVLQKFGVLTTSDGNNHYLCITRRNLVTIYWKNNDELVVISAQEVGQDLLPKPSEKIKEKKFEVLCSQDKMSLEEQQVWQDALEGLDMDSFLDDF